MIQNFLGSEDVLNYISVQSGATPQPKMALVHFFLLMLKGILHESKSLMHFGILIF